MPIAAVPAYLGNEYKDASPGMRFGMYLKLWGVNRRSKDLLWETFDFDYEIRGQNQQEREVKHENKVAALSDAKRLNAGDKRTMQALLVRQAQTFSAIATENASLRLDAFAAAPFTTGLGNEHPLENGFAFLSPYGLPYLPGSGVKGVLRQAARELARGEWGETHGWSEEKTHALQAGKEHIALSVIDALFGLESSDGGTQHVRGALTFWDVIPQIEGDSLMVDIMTPHQSHYYQQKPFAGSSTPHDSGQPTPISFLTVPPGSGFTFHVTCDLAHLKRLAPDLAEGDRWKALLNAAFKHAFEWLGFGAKTAVGYGAMREGTAGDASCATPEQPGERSQQRSASPRARGVPAETVWDRARLKFNSGNGTLTAVGPANAEANALAPRGLELLASLPAEVQRKVRANRYVRVTAKVRGSELVAVEA
jgi:CRISPR-associated protein Cmr6